MNLLFELVTSILRGVVKVVLIALTAVFAVSVLCMGLLLALATAIRFLLTGRKSAVFTTFTRFSQAVHQFRRGGGSGRTAAVPPDSADIVDVEAHEVRNVLSAPSPTKPLD